MSTVVATKAQSMSCFVCTMMSGDSTTSNYSFVDNNPYEVNTAANLLLTYDSTNAAYSRGCCT